MTVPRKRFGQNFLRDTNAINRILSNIAPAKNQLIIEVGPGQGALTTGLVSSGCDLTLIEIDRNLSDSLSTIFPSSRLINEDVLTFDFAELGEGPFRVVGNLPYNISTPLLFKLFADRARFTDMHFMLQSEVVNRMTAQPSTRDYGRLSVMVQLYSEVEKLFEVPPEAFSPKPKVRSAIVRLKIRDHSIEKPARLEEVLKTAFSARRKTVRNALRKLLKENELIELGINPSWRPENLTPEQFMVCASFLEEKTT